MPEIPSSWADWLQRVDPLEIFYAVIASLILGFLARWSRVLDRVKLLVRDGRATRRYKKALRADCEHLIVVGRRQGFSLGSTFVQLDVVQSELVLPPEGGPIADWQTGSVVLVGGPGAGKSTLVKHRVLESLGTRAETLPLYFRLRDYQGYESIEEALTHRLKTVGFPKPDEVLLRTLQSNAVLCVLDGLDEVKQELRPRVVADINAFFAKHCNRSGPSLVVTCRKEAYRDTPLDIPTILEVCPLSDQQIRVFAERWPPGYPQEKSAASFWRDLSATPKVHELARSPLLLVGGLMQYTESNEGIPEERYQYLQRVARWLIADWSTAQGHPPDALRPLYDRLLPLLAYEMHSRNVSEITSTDAAQLFERWLPQFGHAPSDAQDVIDSIRSRTGILVIDDQHNIVFAQFGLQEFFASQQLPQQKTPATVGTLQPLTWWREAILLAVAQQRDPSPWLDALFSVEPFLATSAVAECPTPSSTQQARAVQACLQGIDKNNQSVTAALVPLLRKVKGDLEEQLCKELARRLHDRKKKARIVGIALATAGTEAATSTLARHPQIWADCLSGAGYLSESFESLLLRWVEHGTDAQTAAASDILATRVRGSLTDKLLTLLPKLSSAKANRLASSVITQALQNSNRFPHGMPSQGLAFLAACVPFVADPKALLKAEWNRQLEAAHERKLIPNRLALIHPATAPGPIAAALFVTSKKGPRYSPKQLRRVLEASMSWRYDAYAILVWVCTGLVLTAMAAPAAYRPGLVVLSAVGLVYAAAARLPSIPWSVAVTWFEPRVTHGVQIATLAITIAGITASLLTPRAVIALAIAAGGAVALSFSLCSALSQNRLIDEHELGSNSIHATIRRQTALVAVMAVTVLFAALLGPSEWTNSIVLLALTWGILCVLLAATFCSFLLSDYRRLKRAARDALMFLDSSRGGVRLPASFPGSSLLVSFTNRYPLRVRVK